MKVMTVLGTRPEIIRLSQIIPKLDQMCEHILVHTGQNFDPKLSDIFFEQLDVRKPDYHLNIKGNNFADQIGNILAASYEIIMKENPDRILILGDTNSSLISIIAKRVGIPIYHMEAGNRCYDDRVPEEVNRRIIDHSSDILLPYTERSRANLIKEGIPGHRIYVTGNPIYEVLKRYEPQINSSGILTNLGIQKRNYFLVTMHRAENVDSNERLLSLVQSLEMLGEKYDLDIICSMHPRTKDRMKQFNINFSSNKIKMSDPFGFFDFIALEKNAFCVISDSGTVQEECCILRVSNITIRDVTERPETIECGSNILSGVDAMSILQCVESAVSNSGQWYIPQEYLVDNVSSTVLKIITGYRTLNT